MPRATNRDGSLAYLDKCMIVTPCGNICLRILPDLTDGKQVTYSDASIPGRSSPLVTFAHSDARNISSELHFMTTKSSDIDENLTYIAIIQNLALPGPATGNVPFTPPPVSKIVCGQLLDGNKGVCVILKNYSIRYPTDVAWDDTTYLPYKFSISCQWQVVYACKDLPTNQCLATSTNPSSTPSNSSTTTPSNSSTNPGNSGTPPGPFPPSSDNGTFPSGSLGVLSLPMRLTQFNPRRSTGFIERAMVDPRRFIRNV